VHVRAVVLHHTSLHIAGHRGICETDCATVFGAAVLNKNAVDDLDFRAVDVDGTTTTMAGAVADLEALEFRRASRACEHERSTIAFTIYDGRFRAINGAYGDRFVDLDVLVAVTRVGAIGDQDDISG